VRGDMHITFLAEELGGGRAGSEWMDYIKMDLK
jgi:hypothetical protein